MSVCTFSTMVTMWKCPFMNSLSKAGTINTTVWQRVYQHVLQACVEEKIRESFASFEGLEHRLEYVATVRGVEFINDSKATNVNSVWFALESMKKPVVLILGGQDKGNDYTEILALVKEKVKAIVCMGVDNAPIHAAFGQTIETIVDTARAEDAVHAAYALAENGDVVLLSPACASFDLFKNYEDRGQQFKEAVRDL